MVREDVHTTLAGMRFGDLDSVQILAELLTVVSGAFAHLTFYGPSKNCSHTSSATARCCKSQHEAGEILYNSAGDRVYHEKMGVLVPSNVQDRAEEGTTHRSHSLPFKGV
jgi:hypothetical protein